MPPFGQFGPQSVAQSAPGANVYELRLRELERRVNELVTARSGNYTTITGTLDVAGTENVSGNLNVTGNLDVSGTTNLDGSLTLVGGATLTASGDVESSNYVTGTAGWKLDGTTGDIEINDVTIRGGIIGDAALSHPVSSQAITGGVVLSLTFTGSMASYITKTVTVPAGFTSAIVYATTVATALGGSPVSVEARTQINSSNGPTVVGLGNAGAIAVGPYSVHLTGLTGGGTFTVEAQALDGLGAGSMAPTSGGISLNGYVLFLA